MAYKQFIEEKKDLKAFFSKSVEDIQNEVKALKNPLSLGKLNMIFLIVSMLITFSSLTYGYIQHTKKTPPDVELVKASEEWLYYFYNYYDYMKDKNPNTHKSFTDAMPFPDCDFPKEIINKKK